MNAALEFCGGLSPTSTQIPMAFFVNRLWRQYG